MESEWYTIDHKTAKVWYDGRGNLHRTDGPAVMHTSGVSAWWVDGKQCRSSADYQKAANLTTEQVIELVLLYGQIS